MTNEPIEIVREYPFQLLLIDADYIFRLGLSTALQSEESFQVIAELDDFEAAGEFLQEQMPDLIVVEPLSPTLNLGLKFCQQVKNDYPELPIFLLTRLPLSSQLLSAQELGVEGYAIKGTSLEELTSAWQQVSQGYSSWLTSPNFALAPSKSINNSTSFSSWFSRLRHSSLAQIEASLEKINNKLNRQELSTFDWLFWSGRKRELLAARWLIKQIIPTEVVILQQPQAEQYLLQQRENTDVNNDAVPSVSGEYNIFQANITSKINYHEGYCEDELLEIDVLKTNYKQQLFSLVNNIFLAKIKALKQQLPEISEENLIGQQELILRDIWQKSTIDFFTKNYPDSIELGQYKIIDFLPNSYQFIKLNILNKVYFFEELLLSLVKEKRIEVEGVYYDWQTPEARQKLDLITENLIISISNGVMQIILNNFPEDPYFKQNLYQSQYRSSRAVAKLRNRLSGKYFKEKYWEQPKQIFESQYRLFQFQKDKIKVSYLMGDRSGELAQLRGIPWWVTIAIETRDAIAPGFRTLISYLGKGLIYILTKVIGKAIGLIGKGIVQGLGSSLQEAKTKSQEKNKQS